MSRIVQFRCPGCKRLAFKFDTSKGQALYTDPEVKFDNETKTLTCSKCGMILKVTLGGLVEVEDGRIPV